MLASLRRIGPVAWLTLVVVAAGCTSSGPSSPGDARADDDLPAPAPGTGIITGVVVDDAIRPIVEATVRLLHASVATAEAQTDEDGRFTFVDIAPGAYFVAADRAGFSPSQARADVIAGQVSEVQVRLQMDPDVAPYASVQSWTGYMTCSTNAAPACDFVNIVANLVGQGPVTNDNFNRTFFFDPDPDHVQVELVFEPSTPLNTELVLRTTGPVSPPFPYVEGESPVIQRIDRALADTIGLRNATVRPNLHVTVFAGANIAGQDMPADSYAGVQFEQDFQVIVVAFHRYVPPADWTFTASGAVPPP